MNKAETIAKASDLQGRIAKLHEDKDKDKLLALSEAMELADLLEQDAQHDDMLHYSAAAKADQGEMEWCPGCRRTLLARRLQKREHDRNRRDAGQDPNTLNPVNRGSF